MTCRASVDSMTESLLLRDKILQSVRFAAHRFLSTTDWTKVIEEVLASDGKLNLRGHAKSEALTARFGPRGFDYAGDSKKDIAIFAN